MSQSLAYYSVYVPLIPEERDNKIKGLFRIFNGYLKDVGLDESDVRYNKDSIYEMIERVDKRKVYFRVFYNKDMSEKNEVALYCFWILKLAPFFCVSNPNIRINVNFAVYFLFKVIQYNCINFGKKLVFSNEYVRSTKYAFTFRDISKEAIMHTAETLLTV